MQNTKLCLLNSLTPYDYPKSGTCYKSSIHMQLCYYLSTGKIPKCSDFKTYTSDDESRKLFGPYVIRAPDKDTARTIAITNYVYQSGLSKFITTREKHKSHNTESGEMQEDVPNDGDGFHTMASQGFYCPSRIESALFKECKNYVLFVEFNPKKKEIVEKDMLKKLYSLENELFINDFKTCYTHGPGLNWSCCDQHDLVSASDNPDTSFAERNTRCIREHVTMCLGKVFSPQHRTSTFKVYEQLALKKTFDVRPTAAEWYSKHPYFSEHSEKYIREEPKKQDMKHIPDKIKQCIKDKHNAMLQHADSVLLEKFVTFRFNSWTHMLQKDNLFDITVVKDKRIWTMEEKLHFILHPPMPVLSEQIFKKQYFEYNAKAYEFSIILLNKMYILVDHDKPVTILYNMSKQACVLFDVTNADILQNMLEKGIEEQKIPQEHINHVKNVVIIKHSENIFKIIHHICESCHIPYVQFIQHVKTEFNHANYTKMIT